MSRVLTEVQTPHSPESLAGQLSGEAGLVLLRSGMAATGQGRFSFVAARPFLTFTAKGNRCILRRDAGTEEHMGNPWLILETFAAPFALPEELPFPAGGCFGYWGYELKNHLEPRLPQTAVDDLRWPDLSAGFYDSLVVFDHQADRTWVVSTGFRSDGSRSASSAAARLNWWQEQLQREPAPSRDSATELSGGGSAQGQGGPAAAVKSSMSREDFIRRVRLAQDYIRSGDIYQVNLSHRMQAGWASTGWDLFESLSTLSPAPYSAFLSCGSFEVVSSSPELFLRMSGQGMQTRPIKGTRPRSSDPTRDTQLAFELQTSTKEMAELIMITDLLRNDLGRVAEFGSVNVPEVVRLERYAQVQHLVSTIGGRLRPGLSHLQALAACFPGGSITGAPKIRAMEIIDELEPVTRGVYTGAIGYIGFNRESQLSIAIRTAVHSGGTAWFHTGAGIVADSNPEAEYEETLAKAEGFLQALQTSPCAYWTRPRA